MDRDVLLVVLTGVVILHSLWILAILAGLIATLTGWLFRHPRVQFGLNLLLVGSIISWLILGACLFTVWENGLRSQLDWPVTSGGFLVRTLDSLGLPVTSLGVSLVADLVIALLIFVQLWPVMHRPHRREAAL